MKIDYRRIADATAVTTRVIVQNRAEIHDRLDRLRATLPAGSVAGPAICTFNFITSASDGYDVTLAIPVREGTNVSGLRPGAAPSGTDSRADATGIRLELLPALEVLSLVHEDGSESLGKAISAVFAYANQYAIISDEFYREVYHDAAGGDPGLALRAPTIEVQFVIHNWNGKLASGLERVLGTDARDQIMAGAETLQIESGLDARFEWVKSMLARLDERASEHEKWDVISGCAHVFPQGQLDKLADVFRAKRQETGDALQAVDAVIDFMNDDSGWVDGGRRDGHTVITAKSPRDPKAYAEATTDLERRQAYCFCPLLRTRMDQGMPIDFCYCGSGWFRQQWETATGKPVTVDILQSVARGDEKCEFAVHLDPGI